MSRPLTLRRQIEVLRAALRPFAARLDPDQDFDDEPFTPADIAGSDVHLMLMGHISGDLGDMPLACFQEAADALAVTSG